MKDRNLINSLCEKVKNKSNGWNPKTVQRISYTAIFVAVISFAGFSYFGSSADVQVSLPGSSVSDSIDVNLLQGQKVDQVNQADAMAASISDSTGGQLANGATTATATTADEVKASCLNGQLVVVQ